MALASEIDMDKLSLPTGENILMAAFRAVAEAQVTEAAELVAMYEQHFISTVPVPSFQPQTFERFSMVDPNIRLTVQSSTTTG